MEIERVMDLAQQDIEPIIHPTAEQIQQLYAELVANYTAGFTASDPVKQGQISATLELFRALGLDGLQRAASQKGIDRQPAENIADTVKIVPLQKDTVKDMYVRLVFEEAIFQGYKPQGRPPENDSEAHEWQLRSAGYVSQMGRLLPMLNQGRLVAKAREAGQRYKEFSGRR